MSDGADRVDRAQEPVELVVAQRGEQVLRARGSQRTQNGRLRPTKFSHSRLWDSWIPSETPVPSPVRTSAGSDWRS